MLLASAAGRAGENIRQLVRLRGTTLLKDIWTDFTFDLAGAFTVIEVTVRDIFAAIVDSVVGSVLYVLQQVAELTGVGAEAASRMKADYDRRVLEENAARERELTDRIAALEEARTAESRANAAELDAAREELERLRQLEGQRSVSPPEPAAPGPGTRQSRPPRGRRQSVTSSTGDGDLYATFAQLLLEQEGDD